MKQHFMVTIIVTIVTMFYYRLHNLQYAAIMLNGLAVALEMLAWHNLYGAKVFVVLNSVYQVCYTSTNWKNILS